MTSSANSTDDAWVLEAVIRTAPAADIPWREQLDRLREIASYVPETQTWHVRLGALDLGGVQMLQLLFDVARLHGTEVRLTPAAVPAHWSGPVLQRGPDVAALLEAQADQGRQLGHLHMA